MSNKKPKGNALDDVPAVTRFINVLEHYVNDADIRPRQGYATDWVLLALVFEEHLGRESRMQAC